MKFIVLILILITCYASLLNADSSLLCKDLTRETEDNIWSRDGDIEELNAKFKEYLDSMALARSTVNEDFFKEVSCINDLLDNTVKRLKEEARAFSWDRKIGIGSVLLSIYRIQTLFNTMHSNVFSVLPLKEIFANKSLLNSFRRANIRLTLAEVVTHIKNSSVEEVKENLVLLGAHLSEQFSNSDPYSDLELYVKSYNDITDVEKRNLFLKITAMHIIKNGFKFTEKGRNAAILNIELLINQINLTIGQYKRNSPQRKELKEQLKKHNQEIKILKSKNFELMGAFDVFKEGLLRSNEDKAEVLVDEAINYAKELYQKEYIDRGLTLKEADVFLAINRSGPAAFFNSLIFKPTFVTHMGIIAAGEESSIKYYFIADVREIMTERNILDTFEDSVILRPNYPLVKGITSKALKNFHKYKKRKYDTLFTEEILNKKGELTVYCGEFVHYVFKNLFDVKGETFPSPYDSVNSKLDGLTDIALSNSSRLGYDFKINYFTPDALFYSTHLNYHQAYFASLSPLPHTPEGKLYDFKRNMHALTSIKLQDKFRNVHVRKMSWNSRMKLRTYLTAKFFRTRMPISKHVLPAAVDLLVLLDLPPGEKALYFLQLFELYLSFEKTLVKLQVYDQNGSYIADWKEKYMDHYESKFIVQMNNVFDTKYGLLD